MPPVGANAAKAPATGTLRVALTQEIDSLNPFIAFYLSSTSALRFAYDNLTNYDPKTLRPSDSLATDWKVSPDKLTWTYTIRQDAKWSDGKPLTARDIAFTYNLMLKNSDARTANGSYLTPVKSVSAPSPTQLVITTKSPSATMLSIGVPIVPEHVWKGIKNIGDFTNEKFPIVGSGPFIITEHKKGQFLRLKANKNYWLGAPKIDELVLLFYKNTDAAVQAINRGEADLTHNLTAPQFNSLKGAKNVEAHNGRGRRFYELQLNPGAATVKNKTVGDGHAALKDLRVRQAIHHAMDKKTLVNKVLGGYGESGEGYIPPLFKDYHWAPAQNERIGFDLNRANQILDQAGYKRGSGGIRTMPQGGKKLEFRLGAHASRSDDARLAEHIKGWLSSLGITVKVQSMEDNKLNDDLAAGNYDMLLGGWSVNPDPDFVLGLQTCSARPDDKGKGGTTDNFLCDAEYDSLYKQQNAELDAAKRAEVVKRMQKRLYDLSGSIILYYASALEAYRSDRFGDFQEMPDPGGIIWGQDGYWSFVTVKPASGQQSEAADDDGGGVLLWLLGAGLIVVGLAGGVFVTRRRRATAADRE